MEQTRLETAGVVGAPRTEMAVFLRRQFVPEILAVHPAASQRSSLMMKRWLQHRVHRGEMYKECNATAPRFWKSERASKSIPQFIATLPSLEHVCI